MGSLFFCCYCPGLIPRPRPDLYFYSYCLCFSSFTITLPNFLMKNPIHSKHSQLSTHNTFTLAELLDTLHCRHAFITCLQETWRTGVEEVRQAHGWLLRQRWLHEPPSASPRVARGDGLRPRTSASCQSPKQC